MTWSTAQIAMLDGDVESPDGENAQLIQYQLQLQQELKMHGRNISGGMTQAALTGLSGQGGRSTLGVIPLSEIRSLEKRRFPRPKIMTIPVKIAILSQVNDDRCLWE